MPRALVLGSVLGVVAPTPGYFAALDASQQVVWWSRVLWVVFLLALCLGAGFVAAWVSGLRHKAGAGNEKGPEQQK